jgi:hypothetical protein
MVGITTSLTPGSCSQKRKKQDESWRSSTWHLLLTRGMPATLPEKGGAWPRHSGRTDS